MVSHLRGMSGLDASLLNQLFQQMDSNQDGSIDPSEFANSLSAASQASSSTQASSTQASATQAATTGTSDASQLFGALDTDGDGKLSKTELTSAFQKLSQDMKSVLLTQQEVPGWGQGADAASASTGSQSSSTTSGDSASGNTTSSDALNAAAEALLEMLQAMSTNAAATSFSSSDADQGDGQTTSATTDSSSASGVATSRADQLFAQIDSNGDGTISQSEWEAAVKDAANGKTTGEATEAGQRSLHRGEHLHHSLMHFMQAFESQQNQTTQSQAMQSQAAATQATPTQATPVQATPAQAT